MPVSELLQTPSPHSEIVFCAEQPERYAVVDRFYRAQGYKVKTAATESVYVIYGVGGTGGPTEIIAAARYVPQNSGHFWLRNLLVAKERRGQGLASALLQYSLPLIYPKGCYCFALPHLKGFYDRLGYELEPNHCPTDIQQKYQQYRARGRDWLLMGYLASNHGQT
ncbi:GNAT family N-acetyltransferase [Cellvibrio sp. KY-YJ-3]|uniref:GNAT family N-acetyltransferase n=1 Tax=Cellvibrio sp. KY-YJ-3 TaxID=454662 RepID=UPI001247F5FB|nr:GNAT family N-acetyltransferase [Cellvibrio sp. KY-YJ-3]QEY13305.1 N-acetyltransferase [Cellvibrio sp. KY-YJ-3]